MSVSEAAVAQEFTQDKYTQSQVELLISQIVAKNSDADDCGEVSYTYSDLYYSPSDKAGYVIDFKYGDSCGYIIMLVDDECSKPAEIILDRQSPYYGKAGTYMYPSQGSYYILADNGNIVEAMQYTVMSDKPQNVMMMSNADLGGRKPYDKEYDYISHEPEVTYEIPNFDYKYSTEDDEDKPLKNHCANIAGVIALNYWNYYFKNDILKLDDVDTREHAPYGWGNMSYDKAKEYARIFYDYMKTNKWDRDISRDLDYYLDWFFDGSCGGTLPNDCYEGFERLIKEKGYQSQRVYTETYDHIKLCIRYFDTPVFIAALNYYFGSVEWEEDVQQLKFDGNYYYGVKQFHTFVAYGYAEYTLYNKKTN